MAPAATAPVQRIARLLAEKWSQPYLTLPELPLLIHYGLALIRASAMCLRGSCQCYCWGSGRTRSGPYYTDGHVTQEHMTILKQYQESLMMLIYFSISQYMFLWRTYCEFVCMFQILLECYLCISISMVRVLFMVFFSCAADREGRKKGRREGESGSSRDTSWAKTVEAEMQIDKSARENKKKTMQCLAKHISTWEDRSPTNGW